MSKFELTENPSILFQKNVLATDIEVFGLKLFDSCDLLNIEAVDSITLEKAPTGVTQLFEGDGKSWHYRLNGQKMEFTFEDRYKSVIAWGGCLHLKNNISLVIDERKIVGIRIYCRIFNFYSDIKKGEIEILLGKADKTEEFYFEEDDALASTRFIFEKKFIAVEFDDYSDKKIDGVFLGKFPFILSRTQNYR